MKNISKYALLVADTVQITQNAPDILTKHSKSLTDISYMINEDNESEDDDNGRNSGNVPDGDAALARKLANEAESADNPGELYASMHLE